MGSKQPVNSVEGIKTAQNDWVAFLNTSHGEIYDKNVAFLEEKTGIKRDQISYVLVGLMAIYLICGAAAAFVANLCGFAYPAYASVKAIRTSAKEDDTQWLIYWTVFAFFALIDFFADAIFSYFPFYYLFKAVFFMYLYLPQTMGALNLYITVVNPLVSLIDKKIEESSKRN